MAYEEPQKEVQEKLDATQKRVKEVKMHQKNMKGHKNFSEEEEKRKHSNLIGQLKYFPGKLLIYIHKL